MGAAIPYQDFPTDRGIKTEATRLKMNYPQLNDSSGKILSKLTHINGSFFYPLEVLVDPYGAIVYSGNGVSTGSEITAYLQSHIK